MSKKIIISIICVVLALTLAAFVWFGNNVQAPTQDTDTAEPVSLMDLGMDTSYEPLPDINPELITEMPLGEGRAERNGYIFDMTDGYEQVVAGSNVYLISPGSSGGYITAANTDTSPSYIIITRFNEAGDKVQERTYGGSDYDWVYTLTFNPTMGIIITGTSQSSDGDFASDSVTPFLACIDPDTLDVKWWHPINIANNIFSVTDDAVYAVQRYDIEYEEYEPALLQIVKFDKDGNPIWTSETLEQWIQDICVLKDGRVLVLQEFAEERERGLKWRMLTYSADGTKLTETNAIQGELTATDDGGFISVEVRNVKTIPQPVYISSIWYDTETVATKYSSDYIIEWRKTYDGISDNQGKDIVIPQYDGSVFAWYEVRKD